MCVCVCACACVCVSIRLSVCLLVCLGVCVGTFAECSCEAEVQHWVRYNIFLLLEVGTFSALVELLNMEIE